MNSKLLFKAIMLILEGDTMIMNINPLNESNMRVIEKRTEVRREEIHILINCRGFEETA